MRLKRIISAILSVAIAGSFALPTMAQVPEYINVLDYGAVGDGITDDFEAIQNAVNAAKKLNIPVYVPPGTYLYRNVICLDGVTMFGAEYGVSTLYGSTHMLEAIYLTGDSPALYNMTLVGSNGARTTYGRQANVLAFDASNHVVANNNISRGLVGIFSYGGNNGLYTNNYISYTRADGTLSLWQEDCRGPLKDLEIRNNFIWNTGDDCIAYTSYTTQAGPEESLATGADIHDNIVISYSRGITINGAADVDVYDNYINGGGGGVVVGADLSWKSTQNSNINVFGNTIKNTTHNSANFGGGLCLRNDRGFDGMTDTSSNLKFYDNEIYNPAGEAILAYGDYPMIAEFTDNNIYLDEEKSVFYRKNSPIDKTDFKFENNMVYGLDDYQGDRTTPKAGPDYGIDWGLPETNENIAKTSKLSLDDSVKNLLTDSGNKDGERWETGERSVVFEVTPDRETNTIIIEDNNHSITFVKVEKLLNGEWVNIGETYGNYITKKIELKQNVMKGETLRVSAEGEKIVIDEIALFYDRTFREDLTGDITLTAENTIVGIGQQFTVNIESKTTDLSDVTFMAPLPSSWNTDWGIEKKYNAALWEEVESVKLDANHGVYTIKVADDAIMKDYELPVYAVKDGKIIAKNVFTVSVVGTVGTLIYPIISGDKMSVNVAITNNTSEELSDVEICIQKGGGIFTDGETHKIDKINAFDKESITLSTKSAMSGDYADIEVKVTCDNGYEEVTAKSVNFLKADYTDTPIEIDADLSEWGDDYSIRLNNESQKVLIPVWDGEEDLSAEAMLKWDAKNLYLATKVRDDVHFQPFEGDGLWSGDSLQISFDSARYNNGYYKYPSTEGYTEFGISMFENRLTLGTYSIPEEDKDGVARKGNFAVKRVGNITFYEMAMPWKELLPEGKQPAKDYVFGFSMIVNENDSGAREGYMRYLDGIGGAKNPNLYGDLLLSGGFEGVVEEDGNTKENKNGYEIYLYSEKQEFKTVQPAIVGGVFYIPGAEFLDSIGAEYTWRDGTLEIIFEENELLVTKEKLTAVKNGEEMRFFAPPVIVEDRIMLPTDCIAALDFHLYADAGNLYIY